MTGLIAGLTPGSAGWRHLGVEIRTLDVGEHIIVDSTTHETAVVLVEGAVNVQGCGLDSTIARDSVFTAMADLTYIPPGSPVTVTARGPSELALGTAPARGLYPPRIVARHEMNAVVRGGGPAVRQVVSCLEHPIPAESLIVYEGWVPRGNWTGWPPHRHDGVDGSPYLEETYYYRFDRPVGFGYHRNWAADLDYDESTPIRDRTLVPVPRGWHLCTAGPTANMWLLNFLAGTTADRPRPPCFDPAETWIADDWSRGLLALPAVDPGAPVGAEQR